MGCIRGVDRNQAFFTSLDGMVGEECMARVIDKFVDACDLGALGFTRTEPAPTGRSGYTASALTKLYVYGYENKVRSSRSLEEECGRNVEAMWLTHGLRPDHSTISEFRRLNIGPLQELFTSFTRICRSWGDMVGGELVAIDGTKVKASNNKKNNHSRKKTEERLARTEEKIDEAAREYLEACEAADLAGQGAQGKAAAGLLELFGRKETLESYLAQMDATGSDEVSTVDPDARMMATNRGGVDTAYNVLSTVDARHHLIIDFDVTTSAADQGQLGPMHGRLYGQGYRGFTSLTDKGFYNGECLAKAKGLEVTAICARQRPPQPKGRPSDLCTSRFLYDREADSYTCPEGAVLTLRGTGAAKRRKYSNREACRSCPRLRECCTAAKTGHRVITRGEFADVYDEADRLFEENPELYALRMQLVEHPFGTIKRTMDGGYFLLRTLRKVRTEAALLCLGYNLKRVSNVLGFKGLMARLDALVEARVAGDAAGLGGHMPCPCAKTGPTRARQAPVSRFLGPRARAGLSAAA